jgi:hypothetical protein
VSEPDRLPDDELFVLGAWAVQKLAADLGIDEDDACALLEAAYAQGRVQVLGNSHVAGVAVDGRWVVVEARGRLTEATHQWRALRHMQRQFEE